MTDREKRLQKRERSEVCVCNFNQDHCSGTTRTPCEFIHNPLQWCSFRMILILLFDSTISDNHHNNQDSKHRLSVYH